MPIGYEMPQPKAQASPGTAPLPPDRECRSAFAFSAGTDYTNTGKMGANWGTGIPMPVTPQFMQRGAERFNINCAVCHGADAAQATAS